MQTTLLRFMSLGRAKALTRDGFGGIYQELEVGDSLWPPAG